jgi:hypothetical protein
LRKPGAQIQSAHHRQKLPTLWRQYQLSSRSTQQEIGTGNVQALPMPNCQTSFA